MKKLLIPICCLLMLLTGCERYEDVEIDVPYKPKLVTACFLQAQSSTVLVAVSRSLPVFNNQSKPWGEDNIEYVTNASVVLQRGSTKYYLTYDTAQKLYQADLPVAVQSGEQYELVVTSGDNTSRGTTIIPGIVNTNSSIKLDSSLQWDGSYLYTATLNATLVDPGKHYVDFMPVIVYVDSSNEMMYTQDIGVIKELNQGETISRTFKTTQGIVGRYPIRIELIVMNCDEAYARNTNRVVDLMSGIGGIPFSEPAVTYSNMSNGIGTFGSFNPETRVNFYFK
jgi:hypothetical protein